MDFANDGYEPIWGPLNQSIGVPEAVMATPTGPAHPTIEVEAPSSDDIANVWTPETPRPEQLCDPLCHPRRWERGRGHSSYPNPILGLGFDHLYGGLCCHLA